MPTPPHDQISYSSEEEAAEETALFDTLIVEEFGEDKRFGDDEQQPRREIQ